MPILISNINWFDNVDDDDDDDADDEDNDDNAVLIQYNFGHSFEEELT